MNRLTKKCAGHKECTIYEYNDLVNEFNKLVQKLETQKSETTYWNNLYL